MHVVHFINELEFLSMSLSEKSDGDVDQKNKGFCILDKNIH